MEYPVERRAADRLLVERRAARQRARSRWEGSAGRGGCVHGLTPGRKWWVMGRIEHPLVVGGEKPPQPT